MFDDDRLASFIDGFFGYGNFGAPVWLIGMEEGGGNSFEEVKRRVDAWNDRGRQTIEDVAEYHKAIGVTECFRPSKPKSQRTWGKLIRATLIAYGDQPTRDSVRKYQATKWARSNGKECLLELLPLPSPSTNHWIYGKYSQIDDIRCRARYRQVFSMTRQKKIRQLIAMHRPRLVVFYGMGYQRYWDAIANNATWQKINDRMEAQHADTEYLSLPHPNCRGMTNAFFEDVGHRIGKAIH